MDWITDKIAIGNFKDARVCGPEVDAILCLTPGCCDEDRLDADVCCIPLKDGSGNSREAVENAIAYISDAVSHEEKILVHCHAGRSRSVAVVAAYLIRHEGLSRSEALSFVASKKDIYLSDGIDEILDQVIDEATNM